MDGCLKTSNTEYKDLHQYKTTIDDIIENMLIKKQQLIFAVVAEKAGVDPYIIKKYPELRNYILGKITYYRELQKINEKIDKAVNSLIKSKKSITFLSIVNKCKFNNNMIYQNPFIKNKIRCILAENKKNH